MDSSKSSLQPETKLHFLDYWRIIRIRKTVILAVFLLVVITATVVTFILPEWYASSARIKIERDTSDISFMDPQSTLRNYDPYFIQTEFEVIQSELILSNVISDLKLNKEWGEKFYGGQMLKTHETMEFLKGRISLATVRNTSLIEIRVSSENPTEARDIANAVAEAYKRYRRQLNSDMMTTGIKALEERWDEHSKRVQEQQAEVDSLRTKLRISDPNPNDTMPTPMISADVVREYQKTLTLYRTGEAHQQSLLESLTKLPPAQLRQSIQTALEQPDAALGTLFNELDLAEQRLRTLDVSITPEHPIYKNAVTNILDLNRKIDDKVGGILAGLQTKLNSTRASIQAINQSFENARSNDLAMAEVSRPYYAAKQQQAELLQFKQILGMKIASQKTELILPRSGMVTITDHAVEETKPVRPRRGLNIILGVIIGLVVGVGLAFFIEYLDTSVKTIDDVERTLQAPVLGVIPQNVGFLMEEGAESPHAEAYRVLRTNLLFSRKDDKLNTIAIVSAGAGEGKSTTVMNLATVFAQNGNRVVIVDSDLRRPTLHKMLRVTNSIGLTNYLLKQNTLEEVIQTSSLPTLDFMASGKLPSSSMGVLSSTQMRNLITELKQRYDFVFFDSPPIMGVSDASILASEVDLTLQVIQYRRYPQPMNIRAKQMIEKVGGNLLGIVLNNINMSQDESYYYYSGYYHEYYSKNDEDVAPAESGEKPKADIKPKY
jgi:polysaccharide biosynthesis transport protein